MLKILGWILLSLLLFIFFLLLLPVHTRVRFDHALQVWCGLGPVSLRIFPLKKKNKPKQEKKQAADSKKKPSTKKKPKKTLSLEVIVDFIHLGAEALGTMRRRLVVQDLICHLKVAGTDAAATALLYGRIAAAVSSLYPVLERNLLIRNTDISVDVDFEGKQTEVLFDVKLAVCPLRLLMSAVVLLIHFLRIYRKIKVKDQPIEEKGGKVYEQHQ